MNTTIHIVRSFKNTLDIRLIFEINTIETMVIFHNKTAAKER